MSALASYLKTNNSLKIYSCRTQSNHKATGFECFATAQNLYAMKLDGKISVSFQLFLSVNSYSSKRLSNNRRAWSSNSPAVTFIVEVGLWRFVATGCDVLYFHGVGQCVA